MDRQGGTVPVSDDSSIRDVPRNAGGTLASFSPPWTVITHKQKHPKLGCGPTAFFLVLGLQDKGQFDCVTFTSTVLLVGVRLSSRVH